MSLLVLSPEYVSHYGPLAVLAANAKADGERVIVATGSSLRARVEADGFEWRALRLGAGSNTGVAGIDPSIQTFIDATRAGPLATIRRQALDRRARPPVRAGADLLGHRLAVRRARPGRRPRRPRVVRVDARDARDGSPVPHPRAGASEPAPRRSRALRDPCTVALVPAPRRGGARGCGAARRRGVRRVHRPLERRTRDGRSTRRAGRGRVPGARPSRALQQRRLAAHAVARRAACPPITSSWARSYAPSSCRTRCGRGATRTMTDHTSTSRSGRSCPIAPTCCRGSRTRSARSDARAAIAIGATVPVALRSVPCSWMVRPTLPQVAMLRGADLVVHHGGNNSVQESLAAGARQLVMPMSTDQFANAADLERTGAAAVASPNDATTDDLAAMITALLGSERPDSEDAGGRQVVRHLRSVLGPLTTERTSECSSRRSQPSSSVRHGGCPTTSDAHRAVATASPQRRPEKSAPWIDGVSRWSPHTNTPSPTNTERFGANGGRWSGCPSAIVSVRTCLHSSTCGPHHRRSCARTAGSSSPGGGAGHAAAISASPLVE